MIPLVESLMRKELDGLRNREDAFAKSLLPKSDLASAVHGVVENGEVAKFVQDNSDSDEFNEFDHLINREMVRHAQRFFATFGLQIGAALVHHALPDSYAAARGAQVLYLTGQLVSDPARRVRETTQFILTVMTPATGQDRGLDAPTTLHPGRPGAVAARRIRFFHQAVRNFVHERCADQWAGITKYFQKEIDPSGPELGEPLNQEDLLGTLHEFTVGVFESLALLGVPYSSDDQAAWYHVWDIVGRHMGIGTESAFSPGGSQTRIDANMQSFLPLDPTMSAETLAVIRRRHHLESVEGTILTNALLAELERPLPRGLKPFPASLMRYLLGSATADLLGITRGGWFQELLLSLHSVPRIADMARRRRSGALARWTTGELSSVATQHLLQSFTDEGRSGNRPFEVSSQLRNAWGLNPGRDSRDLVPAP